MIPYKDVLLTYKFEQLWWMAIQLLPPAKQVEQFFIEYRPWIGNKARRFRVNFALKNWFRMMENKTGFPLYCNGFGGTPEDALIDFILRMGIYKEKWSK